MNRCKVQDIAELITKGTTPTTLGFSYLEDGINFVKIESIDSNGNFDKSKFAHISDECHESLKRSKLQKDDILFSIAGAIGRTAIVTDEILPANTNQALAIIRLKNKDNDLNFIRYQLSSSTVIKQTEKQKQGVAQLNLSLKDIGNLEINAPSLPEQQKIAAHLDSIQSAIDNKKQQLQQLDELVKSKFVEMFGDPITNSKNFPAKKVIDVVTLQRGYDLPIQDRDSTGKIPVFGSNGQLGVHSVAKIDRGIVTGRSGTIGEVHLCEEPFWPLNTTLFSNNTHGNNLIYLKYLLDFFDLKRFKSGVGVPTLNRNEFHGEKIIDVSLELQNDFATFVQKIDSAKSIIKTQLVDLQELLDSKMDEYFGE